MPDGEGLPENSAAHQLAEKIERDGPINLGEYMAIANAAYYAGKDPLGKEGDFVTAPEISQMFGELIGIWIADLWLRKGSPKHCHYVELGPGRGTLAADALRTMAKFGCDPMVHFVETSPVLKSRQAKLHPEAIWHDTIETLPDDAPLLIVANEFFDALPVEQFISTQAGWRRHMVARDRNKFIAIPGTKNMGNQIPTSTKDLPAGTILESSPVSIDILYRISNRLARQGGALLIIDYGYDKPGTGSTLQAVKDHLPISPFDSPGSSDLTAHVDFHALANIARSQLLSVHGPAEQGQWLKAIGIDQRAATLTKAVPGHAEAIEAARRRLTHIDEMGRLFRVMAATSADWPEPEGFVYADKEESV
ncbi:SAM-dependent methyltransferase, MidA [hydrothermal vent metagenome]|uniref:SAM-dependent methyltransferase, MidA n=1 Tax=hydrothermal vent metagenome TaxID=652676 RepID=A0A3B0SBE7_9ZZZZ